jgi:hypothetical protein
MVHLALPIKEVSYITNLHTLQIDSGRKIFFCLREADGSRVLAMQEYRIGRKGEEIATKNHFTMPVELISQFRSALDQVEVLIQERCSAGSGADVPDHEEDHGVEPPAADSGGDAKGNDQGDMGIETEPSPDHAEETSGKAGLIRCRDCRRYDPGLQLKDKEMKGSCKSQTLSWDGELIQPPYELHHCPNFQGRGHE